MHLVSVIIPAYNARRFIGYALKSALDQSYRHIEVILVDDGSTDGTAILAKHIAAGDERVRVIRQPNSGVAVARNTALDHARGSLVAPLDADDIWYPRKIEQQVAQMEAGGANVGLVYCWSAVIDEQGEIAMAGEGPRHEGWVQEALLVSNFVGNASTPLIRRNCLERVGRYRCTRAMGCQGCEDWDLYLRISEHYEFRVVPAHLTGYRHASGSMSSASASMLRSYDLMMQDVRRRRPDITARRARQHRSRFESYLALTSYLDGNHRQAWQHSVSAWRQHPSSLRSLRMILILLTSLPLAAARPLVSRLWPSHRSWWRYRRAWSYLKQLVAFR